MAYLIAIVFSLVLQAVPIFMPVLIFFTYVKLGNTLDAAKAFTAISLFNLMQFPFVFLPLGLSQYSQSIVSSQRLVQFFAADELKGYVTRGEGTEEGDNGDKSVVISITNATMGWTSDKEMDNMDMLKASISVTTVAGAKGGNRGEGKDKGGGAGKGGRGTGYEMVPRDIEAGKKGEGDSTTPLNRSIETLRNINISIKKGELVAIVGSVGSGKSSLLSCILGELIPIQGNVKIQGDIAYCDQRPWILNDTVQNNILFGKEYEESKFDEAIYASCLEDDITILPGGLQTQIGEKGINLSGGQKARVSLARAVYRDADIYLLDDPLSAVDAHVAQFIFHECICNALKNKTRLLVTHHVHILPFVDKVVLMEDGMVGYVGTYDELCKRGVDIHKIAKKVVVEGEEGEGKKKKKKKGDKGVGESDEDESTSDDVHVGHRGGPRPGPGRAGPDQGGD
ncbi:ATP-binding cassette domain-containing protein, partial [archaeon]